MSTGTPGQIRTDRTTPFERVDFTNLSTGAINSIETLGAN